VVAEVWRNLLQHDRRLVRQCLERGSLLAMLHTLTRHRSVDLLRRRKLVTEPFTEELELAPAAEPELEDRSQLTERLGPALARLSARERALVELFYLHQKSYREIELLTGVRLNSIGPTLGRALAKLRTALAEPTAVAN